MDQNKNITLREDSENLVALSKTLKDAGQNNRECLTSLFSWEQEEADKANKALLDLEEVYDAKSIVEKWIEFHNTLTATVAAYFKDRLLALSSPLAQEDYIKKAQAIFWARLKENEAYMQALQANLFSRGDHEDA